MKKTKRNIANICYDIKDFKWEDCMFGITIHSNKYTIRVWEKKIKTPKR